MKKTGKSLGVAFADLNGLKYLNDTFGHEYGENRPQNRLQCTFTDNMQKTVTLMIYAEGELFAKTDISAAKKQVRIKSLR